MRKVGLLIGLALVGFACADSVGQMLEDAGQMMQDGSVPDAGAQQSKNVSCNEAVTYESVDGPWIRYAVVDVGGAKFPDVTVRTVMSSFKENWCPAANCAGFPSGKFISEYHISSFTEDGKAFITCSGREESITVFY